MSPLRYTEKQILCGLRDFWTLEMDDEFSFDADTRINLRLKIIGEWHEPTLILQDALEEFFHITCSEQEWNEFFGYDLLRKSELEWEKSVGRHLTFGALARFISEQKPAISFQPVTVMGRTCGPAGVFFGLQKMIHGYSAVAGAARIAPSTKVIDVVRGTALDEFWTELRWVTEHSVPDLSKSWRSVEGWGGFAGGLFVFSVVLFSILTGTYLFLFLVPLIYLASWYLPLLYKQYSNPFPSEFQTFRDLAVWIAKHECDAVRAPVNGGTQW